MNIDTLPNLAHLTADYLTAEVATASGSVYTIVVRPSFVVAILTYTTGPRGPWSPVVGDVVTGAFVGVNNGRLIVLDADGGYLLTTSTVEDLTVLSN